jgi:hypothetical protein
MIRALLRWLNRDGKMFAQTIDMRTGGKFLALLEQAG